MGHDLPKAILRICSRDENWPGESLSHSLTTAFLFLLNSPLREQELAEVREILLEFLQACWHVGGQMCMLGSEVQSPVALIPILW